MPESNVETQQTESTDPNAKTKPDYETVVKEVVDKVWHIWKEELRRENERRNGYRS
jgi:hypothetical protein